MGVLGPAAFTRSTRSLDSEGFVSFVAGIYGARTPVTSVQGSTIELADGRRIQCVHRHPVRRRLGGVPSIARDVDVVVCSWRSDRVGRRVRARGTRYVDPDGLRSLLLYGLDRDDADALCRYHLGRTLLAPTEARSGRIRTTAIVGIAILVVAAVAAVVSGPAAVILSVSDRIPPGGTGSAAGIGAPTGGVTVANQPTSSPSTTYPPGVGSDGVRDPSALAGAHRAVVRNRSYQLLVRGEGSIRSVRPWPPEVDLDAGTPRWLSIRQRISVERPMVYRSRLTGLVEAEAGGDLVVIDDYADGTAIYRRYGGNATPKYVRVAHRDDLVAHAANGYVLRYLATSETRVERLDDDRFRVVATGTPRTVDGRVRNYSAVAIVSRSGFVSRLTVSYDMAVLRGDHGNRWGARSLSGPSIRETAFEFQYSDVNRTTVPRPEWYHTARQSIGVTGAPTGLQPDHADEEGGGDANSIGEINAVALAETHGAAVRGRSYEWEAHHDGSGSVGIADGRWLTSRQFATVDGPTRYTFAVVGTLDSDAGRIPVGFDVYANGVYRYRRAIPERSNGFVYEQTSDDSVYERTSIPIEPRDRLAFLAERYVRRYLATSEATVSVVDDESHRYRVVATGQPTRIDENVSDYRAVANVTESGLVRSLRVSFARHEPTATRLVTIGYRYERIGNATVSPPDWYDQARTATGGS